MKKLIFMAIGFIMVLAGSFAWAADLPAIPPLPERFKNIRIVKPAPATPKDIADLLGEWEGSWKWVGDMKEGGELASGQEVRKAKLIVYDAPSPDKVKYLWGISNSPYYKVSGGWWDNESEIEEHDGQKYFSRISQTAGGAGFRMQFHLENGILKGSQGRNFEIELKRVR